MKNVASIAKGNGFVYLFLMRFLVLFQLLI